MALALNKSRTAILALDFVNDIVHPEGKFSAWGVPQVVADVGAIPNTKALLAAGRQQGCTIIHIGRRHRDGYLDQPSYCQLDQAVKASEALLEGTWGAQFHDDLKPEASDLVIIKRRVDAFHGTELQQTLTARGIETLVLTGVATTFVVETTARTAADAGYNVVIPRDCVAGLTAESSNFALDNTLPMLATITSSAEIMAALQGIIFQWEPVQPLQGWERRSVIVG
jgi:nicotinamidase-related amidase